MRSRRKFIRCGYRMREHRTAAKLARSWSHRGWFADPHIIKVVFARVRGKRRKKKKISLSRKRTANKNPRAQFSIACPSLHRPADMISCTTCITCARICGRTYERGCSRRESIVSSIIRHRCSCTLVSPRVTIRFAPTLFTIPAAIMSGRVKPTVVILINAAQLSPKDSTRGRKEEGEGRKNQAARNEREEEEEEEIMMQDLQNWMVGLWNFLSSLDEYSMSKLHPSCLRPTFSCILTSKKYTYSLLRLYSRDSRPENPSRRLNSSYVGDCDRPLR